MVDDSGGGTGAAGKARPTQQARSARTRQKLLDAALASLLEGGYAATTTNEVCRRAGVRRGTLLHHFPNRAVLMAETAYYLFEREMAPLEEVLAALPAAERTGEVVVKLVWEALQEPGFYAWLELVVAARTDAELRDHVVTTQRRMMVAYERAFATLLPDGLPPLRLPDGAEVLAEHEGMRFLISVLSWLAVDRIVMPADDPLVVERLRTLTLLARAQLGR